ncbi:TAXI family TRAP transporter solute-binding subunit [Leucobacter sp. M11]|uniref:TAXI family TRAP transporter solute-binding subunit n=1 Tax=Leucobacter sp. M11 TaxID=2993565 RepID=UPI002D7FC713|nr:TAXI family TRAP transporter solute-binding subunit [Leucobacter sp. M11]MEB4613672.1 TAXI family TRAP transporter solute-binding subunit [Leucobacter sp. M11]
MCNGAPQGRGWRSRVAGLLASLVAAAALTGCGGAARDAGPQVIASGAATGIYNAYGAGLAAELRDAGFDIASVQTGGSVDNLRRVGQGEALLGFAQADATADAIAGTGAFSEPLPITAVARVYDEYVQVVVPEESAAEELSDLAGLRVSVGEADSGVTVIAERVLAAAGIAQSGVDRRALGIDDSVAALERGEIDAFFWVGGVPTPGIDALSERIALRMLPISPSVVEQMGPERSGIYRVTDLPLGAYGTHDAVETMTVPNVLITSADAPEALVAEATRVLFDAKVRLSPTVPAVALLDRRQAIFTDPIPLHPGAAEYYVRSRNGS